MATSIENWKMDGEDDTCLIETTVPSGLEYPARDEVLEKIPNSKVDTSRGRLWVKLPKENVGEILKLHSIDNCWVLMNYFADVSIPCDEMEAMLVIRQLVPRINWKIGLEIWNSIFSFPHPIPATPDVIPESLGEPKLVFREKMPKKSKLDRRVKNVRIGKNCDDISQRSKIDVVDNGQQREDDCDAGQQIVDIGDSGQASLDGHRSDGQQLDSDLQRPDISTEVKESDENKTNVNDDKSKVTDPTKPTFRVTCHRTGDQHTFSSMCAAANFGGAIYNYFGWNVKMKNFDIEVILDITDDNVSVGLALTRESLHRRNIACFGPTTLRPTIAYNLLRLCDIQPNDVVCDPMCGGGSIPIEAAVNWPQCVHIAADIHPKAVDRMRQNLCEVNKKRTATDRRTLSIDVLKWDATYLPFKDEAIDVFVTDLPFGKRMGYKGDNWRLYPRVLTELARTCRVTSGRACLLTQDRKCFTRSLSMVSKYWKKQTTLWINIGGLCAGVFVLRRTAARLITNESPRSVPAAIDEPSRDENDEIE